MVGELVIAQSMIQHDPDMAAVHNPRVTRNLGQLTRITADVQRVAMTMRMIPVGQLFGRMARLVRDLARKSGKQADLELDRRRDGARPQHGRGARRSPDAHDPQRR